MKNIIIALVMVFALASTSCKKKSNSTSSSSGSSGYRSGNVSKKNTGTTFTNDKDRK